MSISESFDEIVKKAALLIDFGSPVSGFEKTKYGSSNANYVVTTTDGLCYVLKVAYRSQKMPGGRLKKEYETLQLLRKLGFEACTFPILYDESFSVLEYPYLVLKYIDGTLLEDAVESGDADGVLGAARDAGVLLAKLHRLSSSATITKSGIFSSFTKYVEAEIGSRVSRIQKSGLVSEEILRVAKEVLRAAEALFPEREFPLVHGDMDAENIMMTKNGIRFLDWESLASMPPEYDFASLYHTLFYKMKGIEEAFFEGYASAGILHEKYARRTAFLRVLRAVKYLSMAIENKWEKFIKEDTDQLVQAVEEYHAG